MAKSRRKSKSADDATGKQPASRPGPVPAGDTGPGPQLPAPAAGQILIYSEAGRDIQVRIDGQTVWLTQAAMAELFQTTPQNITIHIKGIYDDGELPEEATCKDYLQVRSEGDRQVQRSLKHYSLDMILAVGYRVRSARGTAFRQWATARLRELLVKASCSTTSGSRPARLSARTTSTNC